MKLAATLGAVLAVTSRSTVNAILFRVFLFLAAALHRCAIGASYRGLTYIIVYTGGISILFLFVIRMLFPALSNERGQGGLPLAGLFVGILWTLSPEGSLNNPNRTQGFSPNRIENIALYLYAPNARWLRVLGATFLVARVGCIRLCLPSSDSTMLSSVGRASFS